MTEIDYTSLKTPLAELISKEPTQVFLIHGEEMLVKEAFRTVLDALLPDAAQSLNFEVFDGAETDMAEVVERINTYSLTAGNKVVALTDARLFLSGQDLTGLLKKSADAVAADDMYSGARHLLSALGISGLAFEDLTGANREKGLKRLGVDPSESEWVERVVTYCQERQLQIPSKQDADALLESTLEKGLPSGNHLLVTTEQVDRRRRLYTVIKQRGTVIDCAVPKGERHADRKVQEAVTRRQMAAILDRAGKTIAPQAAQRLLEMIGFDLRTTAGNLEKLIDYTGSRTEIGEDDVKQVLRRTKKDPIFEFTSALTDRDLDGALFFLDSLLSEGVLSHPLQLVGAAANQLRKLILLKEFAESPEGRQWDPQMNFNTFKSRILPAMQAYDRRLLSRLESWRGKTTADAPAQTGASKKKPAGKGKAKKSIKTDLRMVANPNNPYPIFKLLRKTERFSLRELTAGLRQVARCDLRIKKGGGDPRLILEQTVIALCVRAEAQETPYRKPEAR